MTWFDFTFIAVVVILLAAGAKVGSVWTSACIGAGFLGMALADLYAPALIERFGSFPYSAIAAKALLFCGGLGIVLLPGWILSRITSMVMLGFVDSLIGFFTGALAAAMLILLCSMLVLPRFPSIEKNPAWKKSRLVRPLQNFLEEKIEHYR